MNHNLLAHNTYREREMAQKHFVLIHNQYHGAWIWYKLKPMLESSGHKVTAIDLAACGLDTKTVDQVNTFDEYSKPLLDTMESIPEGGKVILVAFSLGGINAAVAADKYPEKVALIVFMNAFMPDTQHKPSYVIDKHMETTDFQDCIFSSSGDKENKLIVRLGPKFLKRHLYQGCPIEDYELAKMLMRPGCFFQEDLAKRQKFTNEGYGSVARVYVIGEKDYAIPKEFQLWQIENFGVSKVSSIPDGDHMLMLSKSQELFNCLSEIATTFA